MSYYSAGMAIAAPKRANAYNVGALVFTPGMAKDMMRRLESEIQAMDSEMIGYIASAAQVPRDFAWDDIRGEATALVAFMRGPWLQFVKGWQEFKGSHSHWYDNLWGGTWDEINSWRKRLGQMRVAAENAGFEFSTPAPSPPESSIYQDVYTDVTSGASKVWGVIRFLAIGALVILGIGLIIYIANGHSFTALSGVPK